MMLEAAAARREEVCERERERERECVCECVCERISECGREGGREGGWVGRIEFLCVWRIPLPALCTLSSSSLARNPAFAPSQISNGHPSVIGVVI